MCVCVCRCVYLALSNLSDLFLQSPEGASSLVVVLYLGVRLRMQHVDIEDINVGRSHAISVHFPVPPSLSTNSS